MSARPPLPQQSPAARSQVDWLAAWLPHPWRTLGLWVVWLMLNQSLAPAHLLLGLILALVLSRWPRPEPKDTGTEPPTAASGTRTSTVARALTAARLGAIVLYDIGVANLQVAWRILGSQDSLKPGYVVVPVTVRDPLAISLLASIITMTPGTLSAELSDDRTHLRVHVLDLDDADDVVAQIQQRYEAPILELFA